MKIQTRQLMTVTACILAAMLALSNAAQAGSAVICVGIGGHTDVESIFEGCCISIPSADPGGDADLTPAASGCGDCTDVQLKAPPLRSKEIHLSHPDLDSGCTVCSLSGNNDRSVPTAEVTDRTDEQSHSLNPLSSIVLLI